jgi:thioredoxin
MENVNASVVKQLQSEGNKILVSYSAKWCGPCKSLTPRLENISKDYPDFKFLKVDVDENREATMELGINSVPTVFIYDGQNLIDRSNGAKMDSYYKEFLDKIKNNA